MTDKIEYVLARLEDLIRGQDRLEEANQRLENKLDSIREEQASHRGQLLTHRAKISDHERVLVLGNGQKAITVQVGEHKERLDGLEADIAGIQKTKGMTPESVDTRTEKMKTWGQVVIIISLVIKAVLDSIIPL